MKISDALVFALKALDVRYVFGVSGANIEHLHDSIARIGDGKIEAVLAKSESGASFMADGHARVHKTLGVYCTTSGGGMLNSLPGLAEAYSESVPILAIIGQAPLALEGRGGFQDSSAWSGAPHAYDLFRSITKWTHKLERASDFWPALGEAVRHALSGRPGPVVLLIARDLYDQEIPELSEAIIKEWRRSASQSSAGDNELDYFFNAIKNAQKPLLWLGHGVCRSILGKAVSQFALATQMPTVTTMSAREAMPHHAQNYLGLVGAAGQPSVHDFVRDQSDLIIAVGTGLSVMSRGPLTETLASKNILAINVDDDAILRIFPRTQVIRSDAGIFFAAVNEDKRASELKQAPLTNYESTVLKPVDAPYLVNPESNNSTFRQSEAVSLLQSAFPARGHIFFDAGNCAAAALHWTHVPNGCTSTIALGMGTMGYSVGGAIGAQLGSSESSRTISIMGDGAFLMSGLEIHTAIELKLPILFVVFNNAGHGMCVTRQQLYFEGRKSASTYHDFSVAEIAHGLAGGMPCYVAAANSIKTLDEELRRYMAQPSQTGILEIRDYKEEWPPFAPFFKEVGPVIKKGQL